MESEDLPTGGEGYVEPLLPMVTREERQWGMFCHFSALITGWFGLAFLGPLIIWLIKREESEYIDYHGKEALNFQLNILIYSLLCVPLMCVIVGFFLLAAINIFALIMAIVAGIRANDGTFYRYPLTFRLIH